MINNEPGMPTILWNRLSGQIDRKVYFDRNERKAWLDLQELTFDLETFYEDSYRSGYYNEDKYQLDANHLKMIAQQERKINWVSGFVNPTSLLLEIGCSTGYIL